MPKRSSNAPDLGFAAAVLPPRQACADSPEPPPPHVGSANRMRIKASKASADAAIGNSPNSVISQAATLLPTAAPSEPERDQRKEPLFPARPHRFRWQTPNWATTIMLKMPTHGQQEAHRKKALLRLSRITGLRCKLKKRDTFTTSLRLVEPIDDLGIAGLRRAARRRIARSCRNCILLPTLRQDQRFAHWLDHSKPLAGRNTVRRQEERSDRLTWANFVTAKHAAKAKGFRTRGRVSTSSCVNRGGRSSAGVRCRHP